MEKGLEKKLTIVVAVFQYRLTKFFRNNWRDVIGDIWVNIQFVLQKVLEREELFREMGPNQQANSKKFLVKRKLFS